MYDPFVFAPPALTGWTPSLNFQTFESLGSGIADLDSWNHVVNTEPLLGFDATAKFHDLGLEATDALLPAPPSTGARLTGAAFALDRGDFGRYSLDAIHVATGAAPVGVPVLFGANPTIHPGPQGELASSTLAGQTQTIAGARALFHPRTGYDASIEIGRAWYDATLVARPGTADPGNFQHYSLLRRFNANDDFGLEYYRMDPRYATAVLPYGTPENVWGIAWAFPGPWLKGTYQLVNNSFGGSNRVGFRAREISFAAGSSSAHPHILTGKSYLRRTTISPKPDS